MRDRCPSRPTLKRLIGQDIDIDRYDGGHDHGMLLNVTHRSLWLVDGDEDHFVATLRRRGAARRQLIPLVRPQITLKASSTAPA